MYLYMSIYTSRRALSDIKREAQPSISYLTKHELQVKLQTELNKKTHANVKKARLRRGRQSLGTPRNIKLELGTFIICDISFLTVKISLFCQMADKFQFRGSFPLGVEEVQELKMLVAPHAGTPIINQATNVQKLYSSVQASFSHCAMAY